MQRRTKRVLLALAGGAVCTVLFFVAWLVLVPDYSIIIDRAFGVLLHVRAEAEGADFAAYVPVSGPVYVGDQPGEVTALQHPAELAQVLAELTPEQKVLVIIEATTANERSPEAVQAVLGPATQAQLVFVVETLPEESLP